MVYVSPATGIRYRRAPTKKTPTPPKGYGVLPSGATYKISETSPAVQAY
ncbi:unnamed protein product, partial [marine sediment metagenome]